jgi:hypothetical protein
MITLAGALRDVDTSRLVFVKVPSVAVGGAEEGRLEPVYAEAKVLFNKIRNDQPVAAEAAPAP